jgi:ATP-dependent RNA helicase DDX31/DBP7
MNITRDHGTYAIIFSPTRELCIQIEDTIRRLLNPFFHYINPGSLMGGEQPKKEKSRLRKGINILVCTPGRLLYHLKNTQALNLERLQYLIFDEADRILDLGFEKEMTECLQGIKYKCPGIFDHSQPEDSFIVNPNCKVNLVSATLGNKISSLSARLMKNEIRVGFEVSKEQEEQKVSINQAYMKVANHKFKWLYLLAFLAYHQDQKIIVFLSTCDCVDYLKMLLETLDFSKLLKAKSFQTSDTDERQLIFPNSVFTLHGKMLHNDRKSNFAKFDKLKEGGVLISTDVASRGLDFKQVKWVVQFDIQPSLKEYANRIGRTARLNESGSSLIFINEDTEMPYIDCLKKYGSKITEMNRFKLLKDFTIFAQQRYNAENRGTRVFSNDDREIEDEKYEILLFLKMMVKDTVKGNVELDTLEKSVI